MLVLQICIETLPGSSMEDVFLPSQVKNQVLSWPKLIVSLSVRGRQIVFLKTLET